MTVKEILKDVWRDGCSVESMPNRAEGPQAQQVRGPRLPEFVKEDVAGVEGRKIECGVWKRGKTPGIGEEIVIQVDGRGRFLKIVQKPEGGGMRTGIRAVKLH